MATGRYPHRINSWDNGSPYVGTEAPSWGHRLTEQGHNVTTVGKLHYRRVDDPSGFPDQRLPLHVLDGVGDLYGLLREEMPVRPHSRHQVLEAGPGESEYIRYDRAIAEEAARWLSEDAGRQARPWVLFVGLVSPHFPLIVPARYFDVYRPESLPLPVRYAFEQWPHHPVLDYKRWQEALDEPFDEKTLRNAMAAYYGLVTFLDEQIGIVLNALAQSGQAGRTTIIYTSDHGEMLGEHGFWWKSVMYESAVTVPLIIAGPDVPKDKVVGTNSMLADIFPTLVEAVGARFTPDDCDLAGQSLLQLAHEGDRARTVFSEYHAMFARTGIFMIRNTKFKYVHYVGSSPQLFNLMRDPEETVDLARDPKYATVLQACEAELRSIADPDDVDRHARADQRRRIDAAGGVESVLARGVKIPYTPAPEEFDPAPVSARKDDR